MANFELVSPFQPTGDQPQAIDDLVKGVVSGQKHQVLLGVTGSGKTFTMANVIAQTNLPTLVLAPNKTLAAQLFSEFKELFPNNAVEYFVSYYDYYQPEAYVAHTDTFIEKDASINEEIDKLRHSATRSLLIREDVIIVASVSCIYGLGSPEVYSGMVLQLEVDHEMDRDDILEKLIQIQYKRNDYDFYRGTFRVRGEVIEVFPAYEEDIAVRIEMFGDTIEAIKMVDPLRGTVIDQVSRTAIFPSSHYVMPEQGIEKARQAIAEELKQRSTQLHELGKLVEEQRITQRTNYDLEMLEAIGYCNGIENYSRHLEGRKAGEPPPTLLDYFPKNWLMMIDESHIAMPQLRAMYSGDRARKMTLVEHGFRLPSALDNRPLNFDETMERTKQLIYVSATPGPFELEQTNHTFIEQVIRPTGLIDPIIDVRPTANQVDDLLEEIRNEVEKKNRVLVTTLTKRMSEDLTNYYKDAGVQVRYLHSDIATIERTEILRDLRAGEFDVLIGINLLREGLDLPEVSLVAIFDADKEGFLRSTRSLIQTFGRAARNVNGKVILYGDQITDSMKRAMEETDRRRDLQSAYNKQHNIRPKTVKKAIPGKIVDVMNLNGAEEKEKLNEEIHFRNPQDRDRYLKYLKARMLKAARELDFEEAAKLKKRIHEINEEFLLLDG